MKKRTIFKTTATLTRAESATFDCIIADLDSDFNIKVQDSACPYMVKVIGERSFHLSEIDYISAKLKSGREHLLEVLRDNEGKAAVKINTGDNVYSIFISR